MGLDYTVAGLGEGGCEEGRADAGEEGEEEGGIDQGDIVLCCEGWGEVAGEVLGLDI